ncbi:MAG: enoyl-CoA hydratase/isomerase family protein [Candidatus Rokubacteria bacterium]|nr:enoyl-CoA hydratase/isomerase family protein [Candidatus Rokubacteria bacterium]
MSDEVLCGIEGGVATVTLNRPGQRNAMNTALLTALRARFEELDANRDVRVVVVRGAGPAFCSGMDLKEMEARGGVQGDAESGVIEVLRRVEGSRHPTIAMVHGDAIAGGCELALHCDLRVAADAARFGMPLARIGLIIPFPLGQKLVEVIGPAHTRHLLFTGQPIDARRALEIGMVHQVVGSAELETATYQLAQSIARNAPLALAGIKATILRAVSLRETIAYADLDAALARARQSADASEGRRAMLEKRRPVFRGE